MTHLYLAFRLRLVHHATIKIIAGLKSSAEIAALVFGPALVGLVALIALPTLYLASTMSGLAVMLLTVYSVLMTIPTWLLRESILPREVLQWQFSLPISSRLHFAANVLVSSMLLVPLVLLNLVSCAIWIYQSPPWLRLLPGVSGTLASLIITWFLAITVLSLRVRLPKATNPINPPRNPIPDVYCGRDCKFRTLLFWYWLFWRAGSEWKNHVWIRTAALLAGASIGASSSMILDKTNFRPWLLLATSVLLMVVMERCDRSVRKQIAYLRTVCSGLPFPICRVEWTARGFAAVPALTVLLILVTTGLSYDAWGNISRYVYVGIGCVAQALFTGLPLISNRSRVGLLVLSTVMLAAAGSEF